MADCSVPQPSRNAPPGYMPPAAYPPQMYSPSVMPPAIQGYPVGYGPASIPVALPASAAVPMIVTGHGAPMPEQRVWIGPSACCDGQCDQWCCTTTCAPYVTFGHIMQRAGLGGMAVQALTYFTISIGVFLLLLIVGGVADVWQLAYLGILLMMVGFLYGGYWRHRIRRKFGIQGSGDCLEDYCIHFWCSSCALCQEIRTLEYYRVHEGVWQGAGVVRGAIVVGQPMEMAMVPVYPPQQVPPMNYSSPGCS